MSAPIARAHTAPEPALKHDAEGLERPARARTAPVPRHTGVAASMQRRKSPEHFVLFSDDHEI